MLSYRGSTLGREATICHPGICTLASRDGDGQFWNSETMLWKTSKNHTRMVPRMFAGGAWRSPATLVEARRSTSRDGRGEGGGEWEGRGARMEEGWGNEEGGRRREQKEGEGGSVRDMDKE